MPDRFASRIPQPPASGWLLLPWLVALVAIGILAGSALSTDDGHQRRAPHPKAPNIVVVVTDDQTLEQFNRETMPITHRLLVDRGTTFSDFIVTTPLCCPSRASFLTGQYAHNNGVTSNSFTRLRQPANILPVWLQRAGYRTAHVGKYLNGYEKTLDKPTDVPPGWDQWFTQLEPQRYFDYELSENGRRVAYGSDPDDYLTRVLNRHAVDLVERYSAADRPFYLQLDHYAPHFGPGGSDRACAGGAVPDPQDRAALQDGPSLPAKRARDERDVSTKPPFIRELPRLRTAEKRRIERHDACAKAALRAVDRGIGQLVEALERHDQLDDTAIFFTSDNGYFYGEHRIRAKKEFAYEEAIRAPLVIRLPESQRGRERVAEVDAPVANIDLAPTILALAKADPCPADGECRRLDGRSLLPAMRTAREVLPRDRALLLELDQDPSTPRPYPRPCKYEGVRVRDRVLIRHHRAARANDRCRPSGAVELYDLAADPEQLHNLAARRRDRRARLERALLERRLEELRGCAGSGTGPDDEAGRRACE